MLTTAQVSAKKSQLSAAMKSAEGADLISALVVAELEAESTRIQVEAYCQPIFDRFDFRDEAGNKLAGPREMFLCTDEEKSRQYYTEMQSAHKAHGYNLPYGYCPVLIAQNAQTEAENAVLEYFEEVGGMPPYKFWSDRARLLKLYKMGFAALHGTV